MNWFAMTATEHPLVQRLREIRADHERVEEAAYWEWHYGEGAKLTDPSKCASEQTPGERRSDG